MFERREHECPLVDKRRSRELQKKAFETPLRGELGPGGGEKPTQLMPEDTKPVVSSRGEVKAKWKMSNVHFIRLLLMVEREKNEEKRSRKERTSQQKENDVGKKQVGYQRKGDYKEKTTMSGCLICARETI